MLSTVVVRRRLGSSLLREATAGRVLSYAAGARSQRAEGPGFDWRQSPGPSVRCALAGGFAGPLCRLAQVLSSALGRGGLGSLQEPTYRLYNCHCCGVQVRICARCDHGNIYCAGECSRLRRRESLHRAGARYQHTRRGAAHHAARQRAWRANQRQIVTHQGSPSGALQCSVSDHAPHTSQTVVCGVEPAPTESRRLEHRCAFCGTTLPAWTRLRLWQWSG